MRVNGSNRENLGIFFLQMQDSWQTNYMPWVNFIAFGSQSNNTYSIELCRFQYGNKWRGGIKIRIVAPGLHIAFIGSFGRKPVSYIYENHQNGSSTILNQEIYNSIGTSPETDFQYGNDKARFIYNQYNLAITLKESAEHQFTEDHVYSNMINSIDTLIGTMQNNTTRYDHISVGGYETPCILNRTLNYDDGSTNTYQASAFLFHRNGYNWVFTKYNNVWTAKII